MLREIIWGGNSSCNILAGKPAPRSREFLGMGNALVQEWGRGGGMGKPFQLLYGDEILLLRVFLGVNNFCIYEKCMK